MLQVPLKEVSIDVEELVMSVVKSYAWTTFC